MLQLVQGLAFINPTAEFILYCYVAALSTNMISMSTTTINFIGARIIDMLIVGP